MVGALKKGSDQIVNMKKLFLCKRNNMQEVNIEDFIASIEKRIKRDTYSGMPSFVIEDINKNYKVEMMLTQYVISRYGKEFYSYQTLNNWIRYKDKGNALVIRYSKNQHEYEQILEGIKADKKLPRNHLERSLLFLLEEQEVD